MFLAEIISKELLESNKAAALVDTVEKLRETKEIVGCKELAFEDKVISVRFNSLLLNP